jgi:hypothetical protein
LLVIDGDASLRCGISMKGIDIVVAGSVGDFSAFMAQEGRLVDLRRCRRRAWRLAVRSGDLYPRPDQVAGRRCARRADDRSRLRRVAELLAAAGVHHDSKDFRRVASMRSLYHWNADANQEY